MVLSPQPKVKPGKRIRTRKSMQQATDRRESALVRTRSGGRCEVAIEYFSGDAWTGSARCDKRADHVHHLLRGRGTRLSAEGVKAVRKQHVCHSHHQDIEGGIGGKKLFLVQAGDLPHYTDLYEQRSQRKGEAA